MKLFQINQYWEFTFQTQRFDTGAATDGDGLPTYRVYECALDGTPNDTVLQSGNCAKRDDANTTGYYAARDQATAAAGYEVGKTYEVRVAATVNSVAGAAVIGRFGVLAAQVWDSLFGTDLLQIDVEQWLNAAAAANMPADLQTIKARAVTDPGAGVAIGTNVAQVGSNMGTVTSVTGSVGSVAGNVTGSVGSVASYGTLVADVAAAVWAIATSTLTGLGTIGKWIVDKLDVVLSTRGTGTALDAAGVRGAVGLASANLDTQLGDLPTAAENAIAVHTRQITAAFAADGVAPTLEQALFLIQQFLTDFGIVGVTYTLNQLDGSPSSVTFTLNDGTSPTAITRAS